MSIEDYKEILLKEDFFKKSNQFLCEGLSIEIIKEEKDNFLLFYEDINNKSVRCAIYLIESKKLNNLSLLIASRGGKNRYANVFSVYLKDKVESIYVHNACFSACVNIIIHNKEKSFFLNKKTVLGVHEPIGPMERYFKKYNLEDNFFINTFLINLEKGVTYKSFQYDLIMLGADRNFYKHYIKSIPNNSISIIDYEKALKIGFIQKETPL